MKTYIYLEGDSRERSRDVAIAVWRIKNNKPKYIGSAHRQKGAWKGAQATAEQVIAEKEGYAFDGYHVVRKDVKVIPLHLYPAGIKT